MLKSRVTFVAGLAMIAKAIEKERKLSEESG
jgi:hypothetical protein